MANLSLTRVNQKLAQARVLLENGNDSTLALLHNNSLKEAIAFHLVCAYRHYLREIAETYWLKGIAAIHSEADLMNALDVAKKQPAEAGELISLRKDVSSWLSQLHLYYESLWLVPVSADNKYEFRNNLIDTVNLEPNFNTASVTLELLVLWHQSFLVLVARQRETSAEF